MKRNFILLFTSMLLAACVRPKSDYVQKYAAQPFAPSYSVDDIKNLNHLGSKVVDKGVNFNLYSERAERVDILLYDDPESETPARTYQMSRYGNVWSIFIGGISEGQYYGYRAWGPNWKYDAAWRPGKINGFQGDTDAYGNRFNPNKILIDPYARAFHRDHDWAKGKAASGAFRLESTSAAAAKSIVIDDNKATWSGAENSYWANKKAGATLKSEELVIYEVNLKGLTMNGASALYGVTHPGTYKGAGEFADYLKDLGVNVVEFLPIQEAAADGGYWKYWTIGFFAPEYEYAYQPDRGSQVYEFREMVQEFHKRGIEVWLDVVYNHAGEGGLWREHPPNFNGVFNLTDTSYLVNYDPYETATMLVFRGIDNNAYYQRPYNDINAAAAGFYWEHTGTGNGMRTNNTPFRRLMIDSLRYWSEKMHVDGFRFDLAAQFGEPEGNYSNWSATDTVIQDIINDPVLQTNNTRLVAEAWDAGGHYKLGEFPKATSGNWPASNGQTFSWYEWNGQFRDGIRALINDDTQVFNSKPWPYLVDMAGFVAGSGGIFDKQVCSYCVQRAPYSNMNFITVHDGFTLFDVMAYNQKYNCGGPLNPNCVDPNSGDNNNHSKDWVVDATKRQMVRNAAVFLFVANGTPIMLGGDEWLRSQFGNNNAYHKDADNLYNWFRWGSWENEIVDGIYAKSKNRDFYKRLIAFRKDNCWAFCKTTYADVSANLQWWGAFGDATPQYNSRRLGLKYINPPSGKMEIFVAFNMESVDKGFSLPTGNWRVKFDTQSYYEGTDGTKLSPNACQSGGSPSCNSLVAGTNGGSADYTVKARSIAIFLRES